MMLLLRFCFIFFLCSGCGSTYIMVKKISVDKSALASTFARSPDPLQAMGHNGEKLYVAWWLPFRTDYTTHKILLQIIYRDLSEETIEKPLTQRVGTFEHVLLGEEFKSKKGIFSYKAELIDGNGKLVDSWEHIMWVKVLN